MKRALILGMVLLLIGTMVMAETVVLAIADPTWVRTSPGLGDNIVDKLISGSRYRWGGNISYDTRGIAWYDVYYSGGYGWISSLHGNLIDSETGMAHNNPSASLGNGTSIRANSDVNVRTGPGTGYQLIGTLYKGQTADYTGTSQKGDTGKLWYQINFNNQLGWVSSAYTSIY